ncbi:MAG: hypothetical protein JXR39_01275 [Marinilabiliaceae bacterium]|nr:hypothetical protein [Marinilabiliaceae bacterium]
MERSLESIDIHGGVNRTDTDFKAELIAALLMDAGYASHQIQLVRKGGKQGGVYKDVSGLAVVCDHRVDCDGLLEIEIHRSGLYDLMPENLFHRMSRTNQGKDEFLADIHRQRQEEFFVRRFFRVFEEVCDGVRVMAQCCELSFDRPMRYGVYSESFSVFWPIMKNMDRGQSLRFLRMIPFVGHIRRSREQGARMIREVLQLPVELRQVKEGKEESSSMDGLTLGSMVLGLNFVTQGELRDLEEDYELILGPAPMVQLQGYFNDTPGHQVLGGLIDMLLPATVRVNVVFCPMGEERWFVLGDGMNDRGFLGIDTMLN